MSFVAAVLTAGPNVDCAQPLREAWMYEDALQLSLNQLVIRIANDVNRGPEDAFGWINNARWNYQRDARTGRLNPESVQKVLQRLDQVEELLNSLLDHS